MHRVSRLEEVERHIRIIAQLDDTYVQIMGKKRKQAEQQERMNAKANRSR